MPVFLVGVLTVVGVALRLGIAHQSLFADELSTYWIVTGRSLGGVISIVPHRYPSGATAEITPPLYFAAAWLTTQLGHTPELLRAPSLLAGAISIPVVYLLGLRTVGRPAALTAAALTTLSPFMIYYSAEARAYALMMLLVMLSTLTMLVALDGGRVRWWVFYGASSCAAVYSHYTCVFALAAQLAWVLWAHPEARKPALLANVGAAVAFMPWIPGLHNEFSSTTTNILSILAPFTVRDVWSSFEHWSLGSPLASGVVPMHGVPGTPALVLIGLALIVAIAGIAARVVRRRPGASLLRADRRIVLVVALALSVPVGEAIVSALSTNLLNARNLAASWPAFALCLAALLVAAGPRLRIATATLAVAAFALGVANLFDERYQRPEFQAAANFIDSHAASGDVVLDETAFFSPGPVSPLDTAFDRAHRTFRAAAPEERDHPFGPTDPIVSLSAAAPKAAAVGSPRIFLVENLFFPVDSGLAKSAERGVPTNSPFPGYRAVQTRVFPGIVGTVVQIYAEGASPRPADRPSPPAG